MCRLQAFYNQTVEMLEDSTRQGCDFHFGLLEMEEELGS